MKSKFTMRMFAALFVAALRGTVNSYADYEFTVGETDYKLVTTAATWSQAANAARSEGAKLVEITSAELQAEIEDQIFNNSGMNTTYIDVADAGGVAYIWIGGNDLLTEGNWVWDGQNAGDGTLFWTGQGGAGADDGVAVADAYQNWGKTDLCDPSTSVSCEPDNAGDQDAIGFCVEPDGWPFGIQGEWNDVVSSNQLYYLIEYLPTANAPTDLLATPNTVDATIDLTWKDNSDNETGFRLYRVNGNTEVFFDLEPDTESYSDATAEANITYQYRVVSMLDGVPSDPTASRNGRLNMYIAAPSNFSVNLDNDNVEAVLTWKDNADNEAGYRITRKYNDTETVFEVEAGVVEFVDETVFNRRKYTYEIVAFNNAVNSSSNPTVEFMVEATTAAPSNLAYTIDENNNLTLTWDDQAANKVKYVVTRVIGENAISTFDLDPTATEFVDANIDLGTSYTYYLHIVREYEINEETGTPAFDELTSPRTSAVFAGTVVVSVNGYTTELIECEGTEGLELYCSATSSTPEQPLFQWYKDGEKIEGETEHILRLGDFPYTTGGVYSARAYFIVGMGKNKTMVEEWTGDISVYALTPPEFIEQPAPLIEAVEGDDITLAVEVHYRSELPPSYEDEFQWMKITNNGLDTVFVENTTTTYEDGTHQIGGAKSSRMTISNLDAGDLCQDGEYYIVRVVGHCGTIYSEPAVIRKGSTIVIEEHPARQFVCPGTDVTFTTKAVPQGGTVVAYQWKKDGVELKDGYYINGAETDKLLVLGADEADQGAYTCVATLVGAGKTAESHVAELELKILPLAVAENGTDVSVSLEKNITFRVDPNTIEGTEPMTITWTYDGEELLNKVYAASEPQLLEWSIEEAELDDAGEYTFRLENDCDFVEVVFDVTVNKWDITGVNDENSLFELFNAMPTPSIDYTTINFQYG
jgi:hypothetical protein